MKVNIQEPVAASVSTRSHVVVMIMDCLLTIGLVSYPLCLILTRKLLANQIQVLCQIPMTFLKVPIDPQQANKGHDKDHWNGNVAWIGTFPILTGQEKAGQVCSQINEDQ